MAKDRLYKNTEDAIAAFRSGVEKNKNEEYENLIEGGKISKDAIVQALKFAFPDITPRTMKRDITEAKITNNFYELPNVLIEHKRDDDSSAFGNMIEAWFERPKEYVDKEEFDALHHKACETVIDFLEKAGYNKDSCTYGKAQKVVNMTFKHLRCMKGAEKKEEWFQHCHMALDSFTLEWLKRTKDKGQSKIVKGKVDSWSAIQYADGQECYSKTDKNGKEHEYYSYTELVKTIRDIIPPKDYSRLTPFEAEFYIWPEIQLHLAAESLFAQSINEDAARDLLKVDDFAKAKENFKKLSLNEKMPALKEIIAGITAIMNTSTIS